MQFTNEEIKTTNKYMKKILISEIMKCKIKQKYHLPVIIKHIGKQRCSETQTQLKKSLGI